MPPPGNWMPDGKLRALVRSRLTYDEIAEANGRETGWTPTRSGVLRKIERLGEPPRHASHTDLIPWHVRPEHNADRFRHMLQAESRKRQGLDLSTSDLRLVALLHDLLFGRGRLLVVGYDTRLGFHLLDRTESDVDIIRMPEPTKLGGAAEVEGNRQQSQ